MLTYIWNGYQIIITNGTDINIVQSFNPLTGEYFKSEEEAFIWGKEYAISIDEELQNPLTASKIDKINILNLECTARVEKGFYSSATGAEHFYRFNRVEDQLNFNQQATMLQLRPDSYNTIYWKTEDVGIVPHTREQFIQILVEASTHKTSNISKYWTLKAMVNAATTKEEIDAVVWQD